MPKLTIDNRVVEAASGATVLDACRSLGIEIPTMCYREGAKPSTSCMICVVKNRQNGRLIPACTAPVHEGLEIETDTEEIRTARRTALELLLSEHLGDCEGPCRRVCPAHMNIPLMIRQIAAGAFADALVTVKHDIALPAVLGRVCPAPCEKGCRRGHVDAALSICLLKRLVADVDLALSTPYRPPCAPSSGKSVAIVGAGPTGLSAAYYLARLGHACTVFDRAAAAGGALRGGIPADKLPPAVLDAEIARVTELGVTLQLGTTVGAEPDLAQLRGRFGAVVIAVGHGGAEEIARSLGISIGARGIETEVGTHATTVAGVFAGGGAVGAPRLAVRACGDGKEIALSVDQYLRGQTVVGARRMFSSALGRVKDAEKAELMKAADARGRVEPAGGVAVGLASVEARSEATRCMHCDCRKPVSCKLRRYSAEYHARQSRYKPVERGLAELLLEHPEIIVERGKCILCGLCIQVAQGEGESVGVGFDRRGIHTRISVPFGQSFAEGLKVSGAACAEACPTGALSLRSAVWGGGR